MDILIIGGGISGLSLAHACAEAGRRAVVLEASGRVGGTLHSHRPGGEAADFWIELGAHSCYNSYGALLGVLERLGALDRLVPRRKVPFRMLAGGRLHSIPSRLDWLELLRSAPRGLSQRREGLTVGDYYGRLAGRRNFERVLRPAFDALVCQPAEAFPAEALFKRRARRKDVPRSFTLAGGLGEIGEILASRGGFEVRPDHPVASVRAAGGGYAVETASGEILEAPALALAVPSAEAARLAAPFAPAVAALLGRIPVVEIETAGTALPAGRLALPPLAGIIPEADDFYSAVSRDPLPHPRLRGFTFHFRPHRLSPEARQARMAAVLGVPPEALGPLALKTNLLPALRSGHDALVREIDRALAGSRLAVTGNFFGGLAIEDCILRSRAEAARLF